MYTKRLMYEPTYMPMLSLNKQGSNRPVCVRACIPVSVFPCASSPAYVASSASLIFITVATVSEERKLVLLKETKELHVRWRPRQLTCHQDVQTSASKSNTPRKEVVSNCHLLFSRIIVVISCFI